MRFTELGRVGPHLGKDIVHYRSSFNPIVSASPRSFSGTEKTHAENQSFGDFSFSCFFPFNPPLDLYVYHTMSSSRFASAPRSRALRYFTLLSVTSATAITYTALQSRRSLHLDSEPVTHSEGLQEKNTSPPLKSYDVGPHAIWVWGSNKYSTLLPGEGNNTIKSPRPSPIFQETPLRDLVLHEKYGAIVDGKGDVWCWGAGFEGFDPIMASAPDSKVTSSLKGRNITSIAATSSKIYALSKHSGKVYCLSSAKALQAQRDLASGENDPWYYFGMGSWLKTPAGVDHVLLTFDMAKGEKIIQIAGGKNHLLAVTSNGRTLSLPVNPDGNSHKQLGVPPKEVDSATSKIISSALSPFSDIRFATNFNLVSSLAGIPICQVAAGDNTSFARTWPEGRVLGWGQNGMGNIGLGATASVEIVPIPTEVVLARNYPGGTSIKCLNIAAGGNNTFFTIERNSPGEKSPFIDLLAVGSGISGTLGNGLWSSAQGSPVRVKTVSGLQEFSEVANAFKPLEIKAVSISTSPSPHVAVTLHSVKLADKAGVDAGIYGNDVMVWGSGGDYQLGNGKRSNVAVPQHLAALKITKAADREKTGKDGVTSSKEAKIGSGTVSNLPRSVMMKT